MAGTRMRCRVEGCFRLGPAVKLGTYCPAHQVAAYRERGIRVDEICRWERLTEDQVYALEAEGLGR